MRDDAPKDVPLLLLCAEDSEVTLVQLVDALNRSGRCPEVVAGVEHDTSLLSSATDRMRGAALFVLCQSDDLDRSHVLRLTGLFSARKGPQHQLLVVELDDAQPLQSLPLIEAAVESVACSAPVDHEAGDARVPRRDVVVMPGESSARNSIPNFDDPEAADPRVLEQREDEERRVRAEEAERKAAEEAERRAAEEAERRAAEEAERKAAEEAERKAREEAERKAQEEAEALARAFHEEMVAAEAVLERRKAGRRSPSPDPRVDEPEPDAERPVSETVADERGGAGQALCVDRPALGSNPKDEVDDGPTPEPDSVDEVSRDSGDQFGTLSNSLAGVRVAEPLAGVPLPDAIPTELTPTDARRRRRAPEDDSPPPPSPLERSESRRGWLLATLGAVALGGVAMLAVQEPERPVTDGAPAAAASAPAKATKKPDVGGAAPPVEQQAEPPTPVEPEAPAEPTPNPEPTSEGVGELPEAPAPDVAVPVTPEPVAPEPVAPAAEAELPTPQPVPTSVPPPPADSEALKVDDAIRSGKVRAIDSLLIAKAGSDSVDWAQAKSSCRRKRVAGLPGWRLPSRRELARLRRSRIIESGTHWSREKGPHDDDAYAVNAKSGAENLYLQEEPAARAQCVRTR